MLSRHIRRLFSTVPSLKGFQDIKNHKAVPLSRAQVEEQLKSYGIRNWSFGSSFEQTETVIEGKTQTDSKSKQYMRKVYHFKNFNHCFAFMDTVAIVAEAMDHHPEWTNYDNEVEIHLSTHDAGNRISYKDLLLASAMEHIAKDVVHGQSDFPLEEKHVKLDELFKSATMTH